MIKFIDSVSVSFLILVSFFIYSSLAIEYRKTGTFTQLDVLFDADAGPVNILSFAHGWVYADQIHPWFRHYYHPFVRIAEKMGIASGQGKPSVEARRVELSLYCIPLTTALGVGAFYLVLRQLPLSILESLALSCTGMVSFSNLIFGSLPDRFATSGFLLTIALLLATYTIANRKLHWLLWGTLGCLSMGATITQLFPIATLFFFNSYSFARSFRHRLLESILFCVTVCAVVTLGTAFLDYLDFSEANQKKSTNHFLAYTSRYLNTSLSHKLEFHSALPNAIAPANFGVKLAPEFKSECNRYELTLENVHSPVRSILFSLLFITGAIAMLRSKIDRLWMLGAGTASIVIGNLVLHAFWGFEWVLYSQHWLNPSFVLLSGNLLLFRDNAKLRFLASVTVLILVATNNYFILDSILETLRDGALCLAPSETFTKSIF